jgi:hypothetical protein
MWRHVAGQDLATFVPYDKEAIEHSEGHHRKVTIGTVEKSSAAITSP